MSVTVPSVQTAAPRGPSVATITSGAPALAATSAMSSSRSGRAMPSTVSYSVSLTTSTSVPARRSTGSTCAGAGLSTNVPVQATRAACTALSGISSWQTTTSAACTASPARWMSDDDSFAFDPATTMIEFWPAASTITSARPEGPSVRAKVDTSTPSALSASARICPAASSPRRPTNETAAPMRAAACAWLLPLPPGPSEYEVARRVSPGRGRVSVTVTRSRLALPTTATRPPATIRSSPCAYEQDLSAPRCPSQSGGEGAVKRARRAAMRL